MLVTGAAGTIGKEVSRLLAAHGARLALTDLAAEPLESLVHDLKETAPATWGRVTDAADFEDFSAFVTAAQDVLGRVEVLVNVAGLFKIADFVDSKPLDWSEMIGANLMTTLVASRSVLPGMVEARSGAIVNFASTAGEYGSIRPAAVYAAAKAGVIGFTKSLAARCRRWVSVSTPSLPGLSILRRYKRPRPPKEPPPPRARCSGDWDFRVTSLRESYTSRAKSRLLSPVRCSRSTVARCSSRHQAQTGRADAQSTGAQPVPMFRRPE